MARPPKELRRVDMALKSMPRSSSEPSDSRAADRLRESLSGEVESSYRAGPSLGVQSGRSPLLNSLLNSQPDFRSSLTQSHTEIRPY